MPTKRQTGKFVAYDETGKSYTIYIYTDFLSLERYGMPNALLKGRNELHLANGWPVQRTNQGVYEVRTTGTILRSSDPNAP